MEYAMIRSIIRASALSVALSVGFMAPIAAQSASTDVTRKNTEMGDEKYQPSVGQGGKDVIWVPTPDDLIKQMLETAKVTPQDLVFDLGAGDGKIAIAAARDFGATSVGIEYNPDMAALAQRNANRQGVGDKVKIINGDIFKEDFTKATVVTLYLLPSLNLKLRPTLLDMKPGTRIVSNSFDMADWEPDARIGSDYTRGYFWIVPAKVSGKWSLGGQSEVAKGELSLTQQFQNVGGTLTLNGKTQPILSPTLSGDNLSFRFLNELGKQRIVELKVAGDRMAGSIKENVGLGDVTAQRIQ
jgi:hypothetical protein